MAQPPLTKEELQALDAIDREEASKKNKEQTPLTADELKALDDIDKQSASSDDSITLEKNNPSFLESLARGAAQGLTFGFAPKITGLAESAISGKPYKQAHEESEANYQKAQKENPITYGTSEVLSSIVSPVNKIAAPVSAGFNALKKTADLSKYAKLLEMAKVASNGAIQGAIAGAGYGDDIKDVGNGALTSAAISSAAHLNPITAALNTETGQNAYKKIISGVGSAMQLPELAMDKFAVKLGGLINKIPGVDALGDYVKLKGGSPSNYNSTIAQEYKNIISGANEYKSSLDKLGPIAFKRFNELIPEEKNKVYEAIRDSMMNRKTNPYAPSVQKIEKSIADDISLDDSLGNSIVADMVGTKMKEDVGTSMKRLSSAMRVHLDPEIADRYQLTLQHDVMQGLKDIEDGVRNKNLYKDGTMLAYDKKGQFGDFLIDLVDKEKLNQTDIAANRLADQQRANKVIEAKKMLDNLMTGKKALLLGGSGAATAFGLSGNGENSLLGSLPLIASTSGAMGRGIESYGKSLKPEQIADSFISNPSLLNYFSKFGGSIGMKAKAALNSLKNDGIEGAKAKLYLLATDPDFRDQFNVGKSNLNPENRVRSKPWANDGTP